MLQPHLQCSSGSTCLALKGSGCCGVSTCCAQSPGGFKPCLLCQPSFALLDHCRQLLPPLAWEMVPGGYTQPSGTSRGRQGLRNAPAVSLPCLLQVFSRGELGLIAELCVKHDVLCISDEVYEWLVYDGKQHIRIGMGRGGAGNGGFTGKSREIPPEIPGAACLYSCTRHDKNTHWRDFAALQSQPPKQVLNRSSDFRASQRGDLEQKAPWLQ